MEYSDACTELATLIKSNHFRDSFTAGLAIQELNRAIDDGEDPKMALVMAKNVEVDIVSPEPPTEGE